MDQSALLITAYNRPELLEALLVSLQEYRGPIYVSLDYPKNFDVQGEVYEKILLICQKYSKTVSNFQTFQSNQGCFMGVTQAITWAFKKEERLIILEDDIHVTSSFLDFANLSLKKFKDDKFIGSISGLNLVPSVHQSNEGASTRLSVFTASWGWGTWKDRWEDYLLDLDSFPELDWEWPVGQWSRSERIYWKIIFKGVAHGKVDSWAYRWMYSNWKRHRWTLTPNENLTLNLGFGLDATHTKDSLLPWWLPRSISTSFEMKELSGSVYPDKKADEWVSKNHFRTAFIYQLRAHVGRKFPKTSKFIKTFLSYQ
jgi:hypothetical protein